MISKTLIGWYQENKRDLPWRNTTDAYKVWLSEIILQQTQVVQGLPYYEKFIEKYPNVNSLAKADEDEILKLWQGLGYYSRARNLHFTAKHISNNLKGKFPDHYNEILKLKGIGNYTAAAIASFCFKEVVPVVDGNVLRFVSRYYGINEPIDKPSTIKIIRETCENEISNKQPDIFNQAIMEFGSQVCKPNNPECDVCPFKDSCWAKANNKILDIPFKEKKIKKRNRYFYFLLIRKSNTILIQKRIGKDIWEGLYQLPLIESPDKINDTNLIENLSSLGLKMISKGQYKKHLLSHQNIFACLIECDPMQNANNKLKQLHPQSFEISLKQFEQYAIPRLLEKLLEGVIK